MKKAFVYYTGVGAHPSGIHTPRVFLNLMKKLRKLNGLITPNSMTVSQLANWAGAYKFNADHKKNVITYNNGKTYKGPIGNTIPKWK